MSARMTAEQLDDFANFLALLPQVLWTADASGRLVRAGAAWNASAGELPIQDWASTMHPEDRARTVSAWSQAVASGEPYDIEHRFRNIHGHYIWVRSRAKAAKAADGSVLKWYGSTEDIHTRKSLELRLAAEREDAERKLAELEVLYRTAPIGLAYFDGNLRFVRINDALAAMNGATSEAHIGRTVGDMVPDLAEQANALLRRILDTGEAQLNIEIEGETPAEPGCRRTWLENWQPIPGSDGTPAGISVVAVDITERKRLEAELQADRRERARFFAMVAHEMGNALAPSLNALEVLKRVGPTAEVAGKMLAVLDRSGQQMKAFVHDLSDLAETGPANARLTIERVSVARLLDDARSSTAEEFQRRGHSLQVATPDPALAFEGDPVRLLQVLVNLLLNAAKYTADGGRIDFSAAREDEEVVFRVQDNGIGIERDRLEGIFDLFARGAHPRHVAVGGLGIGLAIARKFVQMHGGTVRAMSDGPGLGSTFEVRLPVHSACR